VRSGAPLTVDGHAAAGWPCGWPSGSKVTGCTEQLRDEGRATDEATLALTIPLMHKHLNPFGRYDFDLDRTLPSAISDVVRE